MRAVKLICSAVFAMSALSMPAFAGEPGPNFRPAPQPAPQPAPVTQTYTYTETDWGHSSTSGTNTRDLNLQSMHSIRTVQPAPTTSYSYSSSSAGSYSSSSYSSASSSSYSYSSAPTRTYTTTSSGCYTPSPCTTHSTPTTTTTTTRTYVRPAPAPQPVATPCYTPNPCAVAPAVVYHQPAPAPVAHTARYDWLAIEECRENTIRRLPSGRDGERSYAVCYADLMHLTDYERNSALLERIETASRRACRDGMSTLYSRRANRSCREEATLDAVYAANLPGLVDLYNHREGRYTPNVNVGRPIMN